MHQFSLGNIFLASAVAFFSLQWKSARPDCGTCNRTLRLSFESETKNGSLNYGFDMK